MSAEQATLVIVVAVHALGAIPDVPPVTGPATWLLKWVHDAAQAIARNLDKLHRHDKDEK